MYRLKKILDRKVTGFKILPKGNLFFFLDWNLDNLCAYDLEDLSLKWKSDKKSRWYKFLGETLRANALKFHIRDMKNK